MKVWALAVVGVVGCRGSGFYALPDPAPDAAGDVEAGASGDDGGEVDAGAEASATETGTDARGVADGSDDSDGAMVAVCCDLHVYDASAFEGCSPANRFSCDLGDSGGWLGCTEALDQGTPCTLGMKCRDTFEGVVVPCQ